MLVLGRKKYHTQDILLMECLQLIVDLALNTYPLYAEAMTNKLDVGMEMFIRDDEDFIPTVIDLIRKKGVTCDHLMHAPLEEGGEPRIDKCNIVIEIGTYKTNFNVGAADEILKTCKEVTKIPVEPVNNCKVSVSPAEEYCLNPKHWRGIAEQFTSAEEIAAGDEYVIAHENAATAKAAISMPSNAKNIKGATKWYEYCKSIQQAWAEIHKIGLDIDWVALAEWKAAEARKKLMQENSAVNDLLDIYKQNSFSFKGYKEMDEIDYADHKRIYELFESFGIEPTPDPYLAYHLFQAQRLKNRKMSFDDLLEAYEVEINGLQAEHDKKWCNQDGSTSKKARQTTKMMGLYNSSLGWIKRKKDEVAFITSHRTGIEKALAGDYSQRMKIEYSIKTPQGTLERHIKRTLPELPESKVMKILSLVHDLRNGYAKLEDWANEKQTVTVAQILEEAKIDV